MVPNNAGAHFRWGRACEAYAEQARATGEEEKARDNYLKAIEEYEKCEIARGNNPELTRAKFNLQHKAFEEKGAGGWYRAQLDYLQGRHSEVPYFLARVYARLGNTNQAFKALEAGWRSRDGEMVKLLEDDCWDSFRECPEFKILLRKMDLRPVTDIARAKRGPLR
jgi:tetratricopeptide (TPR) repeat protein